MSTEPFTEEEETDVMRFLGYPNWRSMSQSIQLGYPAATQPMFLVIDSLRRISESSRPAIRENLCQLRATDSQIGTARSRMKTIRVGDVAMNPAETRQLREEYAYWQKKLADLLGVFVNPYSSLNGAMPGGINAKVIG